MARDFLAANGAGGTPGYHPDASGFDLAAIMTDEPNDMLCIVNAGVEPGGWILVRKSLNGRCFESDIGLEGLEHLLLGYSGCLGDLQNGGGPAQHRD